MWKIWQHKYYLQSAEVSGVLSITKYYAAKLQAFYRTKEMQNPQKKPFPSEEVLWLICLNVCLCAFFSFLSFFLVLFPLTNVSWALIIWSLLQIKTVELKKSWDLFICSAKGVRSQRFGAKERSSSPKCTFEDHPQVVRIHKALQWPSSLLFCLGSSFSLGRSSYNSTLIIFLLVCSSLKYTKKY